MLFRLLPSLRVGHVHASHDVVEATSTVLCSRLRSAAKRDAAQFKLARRSTLTPVGGHRVFDVVRCSWVLSVHLDSSQCSKQLSVSPWSTPSSARGLSLVRSGRISSASLLVPSLCISVCAVRGEHRETTSGAQPSLGIGDHVPSLCSCLPHH